ncbi:MAG TPA: DUF3422 domain-containing protein [Patescibacteria group bacterium]|nr:DUF3422 domain-containing protein [Patescibacteria group bacterium]
MPPTDCIAPAFRFREHPLRRALADEVHARPYEYLCPPVRVSHLAVPVGDQPPGAWRTHVEALCAHFEVPPPPPGAIHFAADFGAFRLRWERHTEFSTYTFHRFGAFDAPFAETALDLAPTDWLAELPGQVLVATHVALDDVRRSAEDLTSMFFGHPLVGCQVVSGAAEAFTDFRVHHDGFGRILVYDRGLTHGQAGRLVQRLLEIETYRAMALLAFPIAREVAPQLTRMDDELAEIIQVMGGPAGDDEDRQLLARLTGLAALGERLGAHHSFRFSAARAYSALVRKRIEELREQRIPGLQTITEFMGRRLAPAMKTVEYTAERHDNLSRRVTRAGDLLRTRVDIALEEKNRDLLKSMNRRAELQLRLQETVEGLSVVAISYYLIGLISYIAKGLKAAGLHFDSDLAPLAALPVVAGMVALGVRRLRRAIVSTEKH